MEQCKECELAIYCFSDSSSWVFRTTREIEETRDAITNCPVHDQVKSKRTGKVETVRQKEDAERHS
jgi:uncharacterized protein (UPF0179 family)